MYGPGKARRVERCLRISGRSFDQTQQIEGVHTVNIYENVTPRPNRHDLMIEMEMDPEALPVYDASAAHQEWKAKYGDAIQSKTIFDYE